MNGISEQITSRYKAFPPDGGKPQVVKLSAFSKRRYERMGWTFERTTLPMRD